jgi:hypothetical protein
MMISFTLGILIGCTLGVAIICLMAFASSSEAKMRCPACGTMCKLDELFEGMERKAVACDNCIDKQPK